MEYDVVCAMVVLSLISVGSTAIMILINNIMMSKANVLIIISPDGDSEEEEEEEEEKEAQAHEGRAASDGVADGLLDDDDDDDNDDNDDNDDGDG
jgi:hypothetical protein